MLIFEEPIIEKKYDTPEHILYSSDNNKNLVVIFPGGNNNAKVPILHYLLDYFFRNASDVLIISYKNLVDKSDSYNVIVENMVNRIYDYIKVNITKKTYKDIIFISRSFGNVISSNIKEVFGFKTFACIYVSPISKSLNLIKKYPGLIITADNDEYLTNEDFKDIQSYKNHEVLILKNGDHQLECTNTMDTIDFCKRAVETVIKYIHTI